MVHDSVPLAASGSFKRVGWLAGAVLAALLVSAGLWAVLHSAVAGRHRTVTRVADLDGDSDLDVIVGHTRWETADRSWAGIGLWLNQGGGKFAHSDQALPGGFLAAAGDVDGDADMDLLVLDGYRLTVARNQGGAQGGRAGEFQTGGAILPASQGAGHADMAGSVLTGDLNGDGSLDGLVAGCCYGAGADALLPSGHIPAQAWVWINGPTAGDRPSDRTWSLESLYGRGVRAAELGDLDGDGDLDVFAVLGAATIGVSDHAGDLLVLWNDGTGHFAAGGQALENANGRAVALGDVDGDDDLDALVGTRNGATIWLNQGGAQAGQEGLFALAGSDIRGGEVEAGFLADLDNDGDLDAVLAGRTQARLYWNSGQGVFGPSDQRLRYGAPDGLAIGDFDGDGWLDIFAGSDSTARAIWLNQRDGTFRAP